jgi:hypothetical protein
VRICFFREVVDVIGVQPEFELLANIVVSFVGEDFLTVFLLRIFIVLAALASAVGEVGNQEGATESATYGDDE